MAAGMKAPTVQHYILAALMAILTAAVVITVFFIVLSPARVGFSITHAGSHDTGHGELQLDLTLTATNPSKRATVTYRSIFIDLKNSTGPQIVNYIKANVTTAMPLRQSTMDNVTINASVLVGGDRTQESFTGHMTNNFTVMILAVARFKVGFAQTRLYDIRVTCGSINFFRAGKTTNNASDGQKIDCAA